MRFDIPLLTALQKGPTALPLFNPKPGSVPQRPFILPCWVNSKGLLQSGSCVLAIPETRTFHENAWRFFWRKSDHRQVTGTACFQYTI